MRPAVPWPRSLLTLPAEVGDRMDHTPESAYAHLRDTRPAWFSTPPGDGAIDIMRWPLTEGLVLHRDEERVVLEDPVVLPDGQHHRRLRIVPARPEPSVAVLPLLDGQVVLVERFRHAARTWQWEIVRGAGAADVDAAQNAAGQLKDMFRGLATTVAVPRIADLRPPVTSGSGRPPSPPADGGSANTTTSLTPTATGSMRPDRSMRTFHS
ncbi:hypothetical protein [Streptomyces sp. NPDC015414]|uniref:hypothetical protein n=1 Tax=Streptomyces sp. NPDC015414 TaxID=3364957 RepID=UPI003700A85B